MNMNIFGQWLTALDEYLLFVDSGKSRPSQIHAVHFLQINGVVVIVNIIINFVVAVVVADIIKYICFITSTLQRVVPTCFFPVQL